MVCERPSRWVRSKLTLSINPGHERKILTLASRLKIFDEHRYTQGYDSNLTFLTIKVHHKLNIVAREVVLIDMTPESCLCREPDTPCQNTNHWRHWSSIRASWQARRSESQRANNPFSRSHSPSLLQVFSLLAGLLKKIELCRNGGIYLPQIRWCSIIYRRKN